MDIKESEKGLPVGDLPNSFDPDKEEREMEIRDAISEEVFGLDIGQIEKEWAGKPSYDWRDYEPKLEIQGFGDCVSFSRNNCAESRAKRDGVLDDEGKELNFSDLDLAIGSGTTISGNSLTAPSEYARKTGVVLERLCPYTFDWDKRQSVRNAIPKSAKRYKLGDHSRLANPSNRSVLKSFLNYSPIQIGIPLDSPYNTADIIPPPVVTKAWHAITLQYVDEDNLVHIFDHYAKKNKVLASDYPIPYAFSFADLPEDWRTITDDDQKLLARLVGYYVLRAEAKGEMYRVFADKLVKVAVFVSDKDMQDELNAYLRQHKKFIGISEADFKRLTALVPIIN